MVKTMHRTLKRASIVVSDLHNWRERERGGGSETLMNQCLLNSTSDIGRNSKDQRVPFHYLLAGPHID